MSVFRYIDTEELNVRNSQILLNSDADAADADNVDVGFTGAYGSGGTLTYTGLFRDASDGIFKFFHGLTEAPTAAGVVNTAGTGYTKSSVDLFNLHAFNDITADGNMGVTGNLTIGGNLTVSGTTTTLNVNTLTVEDNIIIANSGPAGVKEDAGFVVRRDKTSVALDTPKETGTASASGTTTTITLQSTNGHGTTLDYYVGWIIKLGVTSTQTAIVTTSSAADPPVLTFDTAGTATNNTTTYQLFNKQYVGTIWDESTDRITFYGFPREDSMGVIDPAGDSGNGNLADYIDTRARDAYMSRDVHITRDLYIEGVIKASMRVDDNIIAVNAGPTNSEDAGYVVQRTAVRVAAADVPKLANVAIQTSYVSGTTILITNAASGTDYFKGWVITNSVDGLSVASTVLSSTNVSTTHTLVLDTGFSSALTAGTDVVNLFNKRFIGTIYDESRDTYMTVGFPREVGEAVIDPDTPVNGNIPDYVNVDVNDINIHGSLNFTGGFVAHTLTLTTAATLTTSQVYQYDIIYLNPASAGTFVLPSIASMAFLPNRSKVIMFVNISAFKVTIQRASTDTIEGLTSLTLTKIYSKTVLTGSSEASTFWTIKG